jgi:hypothetical protein
MKKTFEVTLSCHNMQCIEIMDASPRMHQFLCTMVTNNIMGESYRISLKNLL